MMKPKLAQKFVRTVRLAMNLNEKEMAEKINVDLDEYVSFEENPLRSSGCLQKYIGFMDCIEGVAGLSDLFLEFAKYDIQMQKGEEGVFDKYSLRLTSRN